MFFYLRKNHCDPLGRWFQIDAPEYHRLQRLYEDIERANGPAFEFSLAFEVSLLALQGGGLRFGPGGDVMEWHGPESMKQMLESGEIAKGLRDEQVG